MVQRYVNQGFSGGEKKRNEVLQLAVLEPQIALLDETDSGLDIDSLKLVAESVNELVGPELGVLIITHYQRMLNYITPAARPRDDAGPDRAVRRSRARARARGQGLRGHPRASSASRRARSRRRRRSDDDASTSSAIRADFPILERTFEGKPLRLPGLGGHVAEAAAVIEAEARLLPAAQRERPPRDLHARRGGDRAVRGGALDDRRVPRRADPGDDRLHPRHDRVDQPRRARVGPEVPARRRRDPPHRDGAPLEHRPVAARRRRRPARRSGTSR